MLFYFNVSIKSENLEMAKIKEKLVEWGGKLFSQEPPRFEYNDILIFDEYPDNSYFKKYYGKLISDDFDIDKYRTFRLLGEHMSELEKLVNANSSELENNELYKFLVNLSELDDFAIFLIRDEEEIDEKYKINTKEELTKIFCSCLNWNSLEGALIIKKSR